MIQCVGLLLVMWCADPQPPPPAEVRCPPLAAYTAQDQTDAAQQLGALPAGSPVRVMVKDYGELRARCRASEGK